jgi:hypothetical protein
LILLGLYKEARPVDYVLLILLVEDTPSSHVVLHDNLPSTVFQEAIPGRVKDLLALGWLLIGTQVLRAKHAEMRGYVEIGER